MGGWWRRVSREISQSLIPGPPNCGWAGSGQENPRHPPQSPLQVFLAHLGFSRSLEAPAQPELPSRISRGRQALKALSPHQLGSRVKKGWGVGLGVQELGYT